jgi:hypothetical protein
MPQPEADECSLISPTVYHEDTKNTKIAVALNDADPYARRIVGCAIAYLQHFRPRHAWSDEAENATRVPGPPPSPSLPAVRRAIVKRPPVAIRCPH